jgi:hypothetical protein
MPLIIHELLLLSSNEEFAQNLLEHPCFSPLRAEQAAFGLVLRELDAC